MNDLRDIKLFSSLSEQSRRRYSSAVSWRTYGENELVIDIDDESRDVLFVVSGAVRVIHRAAIGKEVILAELGPGELFGEMAAIDGVPRSASVTTLHRSRIATMRASSFVQLIREDPEVCEAVLRDFVSRIRTLNRKLSEHAYLTAVERLYAELLRLSHARKGQVTQRSVSPPPTQQELADRIGSRREVISRALGALEKDNLLEKKRGALVLLDPDELNRRLSRQGLWVELE